jgi:hypothetical protein
VEQRSHPRFSVRIQAQYELAPSVFQTETLNVSQEGCTLATGDRTEEAGSRLHVRLIPAEGEMIRLDGTIAWSRPPNWTSPSGRVIPHGTIGVRYDPDRPLPAPYQALLARCAAGEETKG